MIEFHLASHRPAGEEPHGQFLFDIPGRLLNDGEEAKRQAAITDMKNLARRIRATIEREQWNGINADCTDNGKVSVWYERGDMPQVPYLLAVVMLHAQILNTEKDTNKATKFVHDRLSLYHLKP